MVNVPTAVLVDEEGTMVRFDEGAYSKKYGVGRFSYGTDDYLPLIKDWVAKGDESRFVNDPGSLSPLVARRSDAEAKADAAFRLGSYFELKGDLERARIYWQQAQELNPSNWNYHRQEWSYEGAAAGAKWMKKVGELGDKPYYEPLALPEPPEG